MGHANVTNISKFINKKLRTGIPFTLEELTTEMVKKKMAVSASEGKYYEDYMLAMTAEEILCFLLGDLDVSPPQRKQYIEPGKMSRYQKRVYKKWRDGTVHDDEILADTYSDHLDKIPWVLTGPVVNPKKVRLPILSNVSH